MSAIIATITDVYIQTHARSPAVRPGGGHHV